MSEINKDLIKELLKDYKKPEDLIGKDGILKQLTKALLETALDSELTEHLGYEKNALTKKNNSRNGKSRKTLKTDHGDMNISIPRDRQSDFEPQIVQKGQRRFTGFDDKILSMYARGMTVRDIQGHLTDIYNVEVSPDLISTVTDSVLDMVREWQTRPLDSVYPIMYFDAIRMKIREDGRVVNKAVYLALGVNMEGHKDVLGIWLDEEQGS